MSEERTFYRTTIELVLLSETPIDGYTLEQISHEIIYGSMSGEWNIVESEELDGVAMAKALESQGSSPEFFMLNSDGSQLYEDGEEEEEEDGASDKCYYSDPKNCHGAIWTCQSCGEDFCDFHFHETEKGLNVECVVCEQSRLEEEEEQEYEDE